MEAVQQAHYHALGRDYFWLAGKRRIAFTLLRQSLGAPEESMNRRVLDVGCGPGHELQDLQPFGICCGLDASFPALQRCQQEHAGAPWLICASGDRFPFQDHSFDLVVMLDVLEHIEADAECLRECTRVLKPGGRLLLTVPAFQWLWGTHDEQYGHKRRYTVPELRRKVTGAGFAIDQVTYVEWIFTLPLWLMRRMKQRIPFLARQDDFIRVPGWLNAWLTWLIGLETVWLRRHSLPLGVSIVCIARFQDR